MDNSSDFTEEELKLANMVPRGVDFERFPSPPSSDHSSEVVEADDEMTPGDLKSKKKRKLRKSREEYVALRNKAIAEYLQNLKDPAPTNFGELVARIRNDRKRKQGWAKGKNYVAKPEVPKVVEDEDVCYSDTTGETDCSIPGNTARTLRRDIQMKSYQVVEEYRKQQLLGGNQRIDGALVSGVLFSHVNFQIILEAKLKLIEMIRLERILEGKRLKRMVDPKCMNVGDEIQKIYGPMDTESEHFKKLVKAFEDQYAEFCMVLLEKENKLRGRILEQNLNPSDFGEALREARFSLEATVASMSELKCDQNPYTNQDGMDFWVMPRPQQSIQVYDIRNKEMEDFLEFNLPLDEKGRLKLASEDQCKLFVIQGYNPAVFDVGWHYSPAKIYVDIPWKAFFMNHSGLLSRNNRKNFTEKQWRNHLLKLRGDLMSFNPFGVESTRFYQHVRIKHEIQEEDSIFGNLFDCNGVDCLSDMFFCQTLSTGGAHAKNKIILFDSLLEGVIVTPVEMLLRVWSRIRFLIEERPNQLLPLNSLQTIYEACFKKKLFPLQWGFKDVEDFVQGVGLPKEVTEDVIIVEKDDKELLKMETQTSGRNKEEIRKEIDAKWAKVLENDDDEEEDDDQFQFDEDDLFAELIDEGPGGIH